MIFDDVENGTILFETFKRHTTLYITLLTSDIIVENSVLLDDDERCIDVVESR